MRGFPHSLFGIFCVMSYLYFFLWHRTILYVNTCMFLWTIWVNSILVDAFKRRWLKAGEFRFIDARSRRAQFVSYSTYVYVIYANFEIER